MPPQRNSKYSKHLIQLLRKGGTRGLQLLRTCIKYHNQILQKDQRVNKQKKGKQNIPMPSQHIHHIPSSTASDSSCEQSQEPGAPVPADGTRSRASSCWEPQSTFSEGGCHVQGDGHQGRAHEDVEQLVPVRGTHEHGQRAPEDDLPYGSIFHSLVVQHHVAIHKASDVGMQGEARQHCFFGTQVI